MEISIKQEKVTVPVAVLTLEGDLDRSSYEQLLATAQELYQAGTRYVLLDMAGVGFLSSAGLMALHTMALLMSGEQVTDDEDGWGAVQRLKRDADGAVQPHVKLLDLQPKVLRVLQTAGLDLFFQYFTDRRAAMASF